MISPVAQWLAGVISSCGDLGKSTFPLGFGTRWVRLRGKRQHATGFRCVTNHVGMYYWTLFVISPVAQWLAGVISSCGDLDEFK